MQQTQLLSFEDGLATARVVVDEQWYASPERVWPVFVDPAMGMSTRYWPATGTTQLAAASISTGDLDYVWVGYTHLFMGKEYPGYGAQGNASQDWLTYSYIDFNLSGLNGYTGSDYDVASAEFQMNVSAGNYCGVNAFIVDRVSEYWSFQGASALSFLNFPSVDTSLATGRAFGSGPTGKNCTNWYHHYDISNIAEYWLDHPTERFGIQLAANPAVDGGSWKSIWRVAPNGNVVSPQVDITLVPVAPTAVSPKNITLYPATTPTVTLNASGPSGQYQFNYGYVTGGYTCGQLQHTKTVSGSSLTLTQAEHGKTGNVAWCVRHQTSQGDWSGWDTEDFAYVWPPVGPTLPSNGENVMALTAQPTVTLEATSPAGWTPTAYEFSWVSMDFGDESDCHGAEDPVPPGGIGGAEVTPPQTAISTGANAHQFDLDVDVNRIYVWCVRARMPDGTYPGWSGSSTFSVIDEATAALLGDGNRYGSSISNVSLATGNFALRRHDISIAVPGPALEVRRTYNSVDVSSGAFGQGWSFNYDIFVEESALTDDVVVHFGDGRGERHQDDPNSTTYVGPEGSTTSLAKVGSIYELTFRDGSRYVFNSNNKIGSIFTPHGLEQDFLYDANSHLQSVTDLSSQRGLSFDWIDDLVVGVTTDDPNSTDDLRWGFVFGEGDRLEMACDSRTSYTTQGVPTGSTYCESYAYEAAQGAASSLKPLESVTNHAGSLVFELQYDDAGRVTSSTQGDAAQGLGHETTFTYDPATPVTGIAAYTIVTDPNGGAWRYDFNLGGNVTSEDAPGQGTSNAMTDLYVAGLRTSIEDGNGVRSTLVYDNDDHLIKTTANLNASTELSSHTRYDGYDNITHICDERSADANDLTYCVITAYDSVSHRLPVSRTSPATSTGGTPSTEQWTYTTGSESAIGSGGLMPAALVRTHSDTAGLLTTYSYSSAGDLTREVTPLGLQIDMTYDALGRMTQQTSNPTGISPVTTTFSYDELGNLITEVGPVIPNAATGDSTQQTTTYTIDQNQLLAQAVSTSIVDGSSTSLATGYSYDSLGREVSVTDPAAGVVSRTYDSRGNISSVTDQNGTVTQTTYRSDNQVDHIKVLNFSGATPLTIATSIYDIAGRMVAQLDGEGRRTEFSYDGADRLTMTVLADFENADTSTRDIRITEIVQMDDAGNPMTVLEGGDPSNQNDYERKTVFTYAPSGDVLTATVELPGDDEVVTTTYDGARRIVKVETDRGTGHTEIRSTYSQTTGLMLSSTVENGLTDLQTTYGYNNRGLQTAITSPDGAVATVTYDAAGRPVTNSSSAVTVENYGTTAAQVSPTITLGYDGFGNLTDRVDELGGHTKREYDALHRLNKIVHPEYLKPGTANSLSPEENYGYDAVGNTTSVQSRSGYTTTFLFDKLNRVGQQTEPIATSGASAGVQTFTYDNVGNLIETQDQTGAVTTAVFDDLNHVRSATAQTRAYSVTTSFGQHTATADTFTTTTQFSDLGFLLSTVNPGGHSASQEVNPVGEVLKVIDADNNETTSTYGVGGRVLTVVDALGKKTEFGYDTAGRQTLTTHRAANNAVIDTLSQTYTDDGLVASTTDADGNTKTYTYDVLGRLTSVVIPVDATNSITTTFGYDEAGNLTKQQDGNQNVVWSTYNIWGLIETILEPPAPGQTTEADRSFIYTYNKSGQVEIEQQPGAIFIDTTFDALDRPIAESSSSLALTVTDYDLMGRTVGISHPGGTQEFTYDDRGLLVAAVGPAGDATYSYDDSGRQSQRTDIAGTTTTTWDSVGRLDSIVDPITGSTLGYTYNSISQPTAITYANPSVTGTPARSFGYDDAGRLESDVVTDAAGTTAYDAGYTYDNRGLVTDESISISNGTPDIIVYEYDEASRLVRVQGPGVPSPSPTPAPTPVPYDPTVFAQYTFDDLPNTDIESVTPDVDVAGSGWQAFGGTWQVGADSAHVREVTNSVDNTAQFDTGLENVELDFVLKLGRTTNTTWNGVSFRSAANGESLSVRGYGKASTPSLRLFDDSAGQLGEWDLSSVSTSPVAGDTVTVTVRAEGDLITISVDGEQLATHTLTGVATADHGAGSGATYAGWYDRERDNQGIPGAFYSVVVTNLNAPPPTPTPIPTPTPTPWNGSVLTDYEYDDAGNRTSKIADGVTTSFVYDARNRLSTVTEDGVVSQYDWDARGALATVTQGTNVTDYTFDSLGRLTQVDDGTSPVTYDYDGLDRVASRNGSQNFSYAGMGIDPSSDSQSTVARSPGGSIVGVEDNNLNALLAGLDRHGDLTVLFNDDMTVNQNVDFDPFGIVEDGSTNTSFGFQGDWTDPDTGDVWMGARWYTPHTATFRSRDTVRGALRSPVTLNRYTYANNNPVMFWDPDGRLATRDTPGHITPGGGSNPDTDSSLTLGIRNQIDPPASTTQLPPGIRNQIDPPTPTYVTPPGILNQIDPPDVSPVSRDAIDTIRQILAEQGTGALLVGLSEADRAMLNASPGIGSRSGGGISWANGSIAAVPGAGQVQINLFIPQGEVNWIINVKGDGRGFDPTAGIDESRATIWIDFETGNLTAAYNQSCRNGGLPLGIGSDYCQPAHSTSVVSRGPLATVCVTPTPSGCDSYASEEYQAQGPGKNSITVYQDSPTELTLGIEGEISTGLWGSPSINGSISLSIDENGRASAERSGNGFPAYEVYQDIDNERFQVERFHAKTHGYLIDGPAGVVFRFLFTDDYLPF